MSNDLSAGFQHEINAVRRFVESAREEISRLQRQVTRLEDIEQIKKLQRCYGYYFERGMNAEVAELFADTPDARIIFRGFGGFAGANVKASWAKHLPVRDRSRYLHVLSMSSGVVDVAADGETASGRWYGHGIVAVPAEPLRPEAVNHFAFTAVYENSYAKIDGVWKIKVLDMAMLCNLPKPGYVDPQRFDVVFLDPADDAKTDAFREMFDFPDYTQTSYPSAFALPMHFPHPVTGRTTGDSASANG